MRRSPAVELLELHVRYPQVHALRGVTWRVERGARAAVLGPNGCGKSTLLRTITAYGHITSGSARVLGEELGSTNVHTLRQRLGTVDPSLSRMLDSRVTAIGLVATGFFGNVTTFFDRPKPHQLAAAYRALDDVGLADRDTQTVSTMSSGQQSRVWLARALVNYPQLLVLDEPSSDLDILGRETLLATLDRVSRRQPDLTILTVTHHLEDLLPSTSDVLLLRDGETVMQGCPDVVLTAQHLERTFGCPVEVSRTDNRWHWTVSPGAWKNLA